MKNNGCRNFLSYIALILSVLLFLSGCETVPEDNTKPAVTSGISTDAATEAPEPAASGVPAWIWGAVAAIVLIGAVIVILLLKKKH